MADKVVDEIKAGRRRGGRQLRLRRRRAKAPTACCGAALNKFGRVDILVNNAGILRDKSFLNMSEADWDLVFDVHLKGTYSARRRSAAQLKVQGAGGRIINTTSVSGLMGNFGQANYSAAKAGIYGFTRTLSIELAKRQGHRQRDRARGDHAHDRGPQMVQAIPNAKEMLAPDHISPVALFLASDLAADINGTIVGVMGTKVSVYRMIETAGTTPKGATWTRAGAARALGARSAK